MPNESTDARIARAEEKIEALAQRHEDHVTDDQNAIARLEASSREAFARIEKALDRRGDWMRAIIAPLLVGLALIVANRYWPPVQQAQGAQQKP